jgi:3-phenylpropionate/cinnamic acid dioxygenase small subunit
MPITESQRRQIEALHARYIRLIDDDRFEAWVELFTDYCRYSITTRAGDSLMECQGLGMLADRASRLRKAAEPYRYSHQISGLWVESFDGQTAVCRSNYLVVRTTSDGEMDLFSVGVYLDRIALDGEDAKFEERAVIADSAHDDTLLMVPL